MRFAGRLPVRASDGHIEELAFTIPETLIRAERVKIQVHWLTAITEFRWWAVVEYATSTTENYAQILQGRHPTWSMQPDTRGPILREASVR